MPWINIHVYPLSSSLEPEKHTTRDLENLIWQASETYSITLPSADASRFAIACVARLPA